MIGTVHVVVAMKPLVGTFTDNANQFGVAGLNIDGTRIGLNGPSPSVKRRESARANKAPTNPGKYDRPLQDRTSPERYMERKPGEDMGRFPANVILGHSPGCKCVGEKKVRNNSYHTGKGKFGRKGIYGSSNGDGQDFGNPFVGEDGKEAVEAWECVEGCPIREGFPKTASGDGCVRRKRHESGSMAGSLGDPRGCEEVSYGDEGSAARFFKQVKEI